MTHLGWCVHVHMFCMAPHSHLNATTIALWETYFDCNKVLYKCSTFLSQQQMIKTVLLFFSADTSALLPGNWSRAKANNDNGEEGRGSPQGGSPLGMYIHTFYIVDM